MNHNKWITIGFILMVAVQLVVPASMIYNAEAIIAKGTEYKFITTPIDPTDPFRGKYITLSYRENRFQIYNPEEWSTNEIVFVTLTTDENGYAKISSVSKKMPADQQDFVKAKVSYVTNMENEDNYLTISYPFDRYYMEESKASDAETLYLESLRDTNLITYGLVNIKAGEAVLKDVMIDGKSIKEMVINKRDTMNK
ncbi:MAG: GDYXXLXY domain-containing protein [Saprospiraceae bacterium]|jgi:uncharacterized membrane-anchored protein|nr:GDYXXLXY domain-containing protein [Saprospiraceae bacterium]